MTERVAFGQELRRERERRGLTLDAIAERTKVSAGHFAGLERGDLSRWPSGIFRRAFVRSYAEAVGLDPDEVVGRFVRLFPDPHDEASASGGNQGSGVLPATALTDDGEAPRLVLAPSHAGAASSRAATVLRRVGAAAVDIALAALPAAAIAPFFGWSSFWMLMAAVGFAGHLMVLAVCGSTPGTWLLLRPRPLPRSAVEPEPAPRRRVEPEAAPSPSPGARRHQPRQVSSVRSSTRSRRVSH